MAPDSREAETTRGPPQEHMAKEAVRGGARRSRLGSCRKASKTSARTEQRVGSDKAAER